MIKYIIKFIEDKNKKNKRKKINKKINKEHQLDYINKRYELINSSIMY